MQGATNLGVLVLVLLLFAGAGVAAALIRKGSGRKATGVNSMLRRSS